jgi:hypothetical protein
MGRPIKKTYFGNTNVGSANTTADNGIGGEGVASIAVTTTGTLYSAGAVTLFTAPQLVGGVRPSTTITRNSAGSIATISITDAGSGYTTAPTLSITTATAVSTAATGTISQTVIYVTTATGIFAGMRAIGNGINAGATYVTSVVGNTVNLSAANAGAVTTANYILFQDVGSGFVAGTIALGNTQQNAILFTSWVPTASNGTANSGGSAITGGDIVKQTGSRRYYVKTTQGYGVCSLTTGTVTIGKIEMTATDWYGNIYNIARLQQRKLTVWRKTQSGSSPWVYASGDVARWLRNTAATGTNKILVTTHVQLVTS